MDKFIINEDEKNRILNLHESATKRQYLPEQAEEIKQEEGKDKSTSGDVRTNHDRTYDYKKDGDKYFYKLKNATDWTTASGKGLEAIKTKVYGTGNSSKSGWSKYPCVVNFKGAKKADLNGSTIYVINGDNFFNNGRRSKDGKMVNYSCKDSMFTGLGKSKAAFPFTDKVAGDKFRAWMNQYYPKASKIIDLDKSGPFNNSYMKNAWNTSLNKEYAKTLKGHLSGVLTFGDLYDKQILNPSIVSQAGAAVGTALKGLKGKAKTNVGNVLYGTK